MKARNNGRSVTDAVWGFFASVRLSVVLLLALAATSVIGTVIPQNAEHALYLRKFGRPLYSVFNTLNLFDMYHSWWFRLLLCLLIANIVVCSIQRLKSTWKVLFPKNPAYRPDRFRKSPARLQWQAGGRSPEALRTIFEPYMRKHFGKVRTDNRKDGKGFTIYGEKGRWTRLGVYAVHFSILLLMLGGLIGSIWGFEGTMNVAEGETRREFTLKNGDRTKTLDFAIRCDDFTVSHYPSGRPKEYRSDIAIVENGQTVMEHKLRVNDPLRYRGINIFQSSYGQVPKEPFTVVFTDNESGMRFEKKASLGKPVDLPAGRGQLVVENFSNHFNFRGHNVGPAFLARLQSPSGENRHLLLPVNFPRFDHMRGGDYAISVENVEYGYYTGLQIRRDPGVPLVYTGFAVMILGCYITFFMLHRKFAVEIHAAENGAIVAVAGITEKRRMGVKNAVAGLSRKLQRLERQDQIRP